MFERNDQGIDGRGGDWTLEDLVAGYVPENARYHRLVTGYQYWWHQYWVTEDYRPTLEDALEIISNTSGPGITKCAQTIRSHNAAHYRVSRINDAIAPLEEAMRDPRIASFSGLSPEEIKKQLLLLQQQRAPHLSEVCRTDDVLRDFGLNNRGFRGYFEPVKKDVGGHRFVIIDDKPSTKSHHKSCEKRPSFLDVLLGR